MALKSALIALATALAMLTTATAVARPVTDCPMRDMPFSVDSPLVDILLNPAAREVLLSANRGWAGGLPADALRTSPPTFTTIMSVRSAKDSIGLTEDALPAIDRKFRALPVTREDRIARCARYDNDVPVFDLSDSRPRILVFQKVNGFYHSDAVPAARNAFIAMANRQGWAISVTDKGGAINRATLNQFDAVIWNNVSGDVLTLSQRRALKGFIERGGGFVAIHGAGGDPAYFWDWYADTVLRARFLAHPMAPQFQDARIVVEGSSHPIAADLPAQWVMKDEWYSFRSNPRANGVNVVLKIDESTYQPNDPGRQNLAMGDHPLAWTNCVKRGRVFYSAIGHRAESYAQPQHIKLLENAVQWATTATDACRFARK